MTKSSETIVEELKVSAYKIPTDFPESDGTFEWDSTTMVLVQVSAGGKTGLGYSYSDVSAAVFIKSVLAKVVEKSNTMDIVRTWAAMVDAIRNLERPGISSMAIAAVDSALWDLKARLLDLPLVALLGQVRDGVPVYGSGGFTSYPINKLQEQLGGWVESGIRMVKMKIGTNPASDIDRVRAARRAIGPDAELFVDANGAYSRKQALAFAEAFEKYAVKWFEEPVSSDDLDGLKLIRDRAPAGMDITAGEYGSNLTYFHRMLEAGAVDVLMADATRCAGITGFMQVGPLCQAYHLPLSAHTSPSIHVNPCCASIPVRHLEYFHDHARIENILFEGVLHLVKGVLYPDLSRIGNGLELKESEADKYKI